jgi:antitoxin component YwqK of YwqJK toxin-antitoxin module
MWLDREAVDRLIEGIDFNALKYDPDSGQYCLNGVPFTGVTKTRFRDGALCSLCHCENGVERGVSVNWHPNGRLHLYSEMEDDVYHGWHMEWSEDGTEQVEVHYTAGRLDNTKR